MSRITVALTCLLLVALAGTRAQTPQRDAAQSIAPPPSGTGMISGAVKDHRGQAVRRATVTISDDMRLERMTVTGDDGRFAFVDLPSGRFTVSAEKPGYPQMSYGATRPFRAGSGVFLQEGQHAERVDLTLAPGAVITGTVYDQRGEPMPGVPIMAWEIRTSLAGERTLDFPATGGENVVSDDRGVYRVYGLPPGDYTVGTAWFYDGGPHEVRVPTDAEIRAAFQARNQPPPSAAAPSTAKPAAEPPRYNHAPTFAPGVVDPMSAATFTLAAGEERTSVDLQMQFQPMSRVQGTIVSPDGAQVTVQLELARRSHVKALNTSSFWPAMTTGPFTSGSLSPGLYTVMVEAEARAGAPAMWAIADVTVAGGETAVVALTLQPALSVTGRVAFDGAALKPPSDLSRVVVRLNGAGPMRPSTNTTIDASGAISISGVMPGPYTVRGSVPAGATPPAPGGEAWSVRSVVVGGHDVTDRVFDVPAGGASDLVVTFTDRVSELSGTLTQPSGAPATDYFVIAIPANRGYWIPGSRRIVSTRPDRSGRYVFRGLPAGDYRVAITTDLVPRDLQEVNALERLAAQSAAVTLALGEQRTLNLRATGSTGPVDPPDL